MSLSRINELRIDRENAPRGARIGRVLAWAGLALLLAAGVAWIAVGREGAVVVRVATSRPAGGETAGAATVLNASGYVTARRQATVSSEVTGRIEEVLIEEGQTVVAGQPMARLDDRNVRASLDLAEAQAASARSALEETRVRLEEARLDLERSRNLVAQGVSAQQQLDRDRAAFRALEARLRAQTDEVTVAERQVDVWKRQVEDLVIRAPFDGVVVTKNAQPGEMISPVSAGGGFTRTGIGTLVDMESLEIEVDVSESYINRVSSGQPVAATLDAYPDWEIPASVIAIVPRAERQKATVKVRIGFDGRDPRILPDMGVKVAFREEAASTPAVTGVVIVPGGAVTRVDGRDVVWVFRDGVVERRAVRVGRTVGGEVWLEAGVTAGERVVVSAEGDLADGARVVLEDSE